MITFHILISFYLYVTVTVFICSLLMLSLHGQALRRFVCILVTLFLFITGVGVFYKVKMLLIGCITQKCLHQSGYFTCHLIHVINCVSCYIQLNDIKNSNSCNYNCWGFKTIFKKLRQGGTQLKEVKDV